MASTIETDESQYVDFDEYIDFQLQKTRSTIKWTDIATAAVGLGTLVLTYLLFFVVLDHWVIDGGFGRTARLAMLGFVALIAVGWLAVLIARPYLMQVNRLFAARAIESAEPGLKSTLLNLVDLQESGRPIPEDIRRALEHRAAVTLAHMDMEHTVDHRWLLRLSYALLAVVIICCLYALLSPKKVSNSIWRALLPVSDVAVATRTEIRSVEPGDVEVVARTRVEVIASIHGDIPEEIVLQFDTADRRFVNESIPLGAVADAPGRYRGYIAGENGRGILQDMKYRIVAGDARSPDYHITVLQPPSAKVTELRYDYPSYMELEATTQTTGHIDAWEGTIVTLQAETNMPVTSATVQFADDPESTAKAEEFPLKIKDGTKLSGTWQLKIRTDGTSPRHYRVQCKNERGETDPDPALYNVTIRPDQPPEVALLDPVSDLEMPANGVIPLAIQARDPDFKLSYLTLRAEKEGEQLPSGELFAGKQQQVIATHDFRLEPLKLSTGDVVTFWIEARDNKEPLGNRTNTSRLNVRIVDAVSKQEVAERLEADKQRQQEQVAEQQQAQQQPGEKQEQQQDQPQPEQAQQNAPQNAEQKQQGKGEQGEGAQDGKQQGNQAGQQQKARPGESGQEGAQSQPGENGKPNESLDPNNPEDTGKVIEKLYNDLQRKEQQQQNQTSQEGAQPQDGNQQQAAGEQPGKQPSDPQQSNKSEADGQQQPGQEPGEQKPGEQGSGEDQADQQPTDRTKDGEPKPQPDGDPNQTDKSATEKNNTGESNEQQKPTDKGATDKNEPGAADEKAEGAEQPKNEGGGSKKNEKGGGAPKNEPDSGQQGGATEEEDASKKKSNSAQQGKKDGEGSGKSNNRPADPDAQGAEKKSDKPIDGEQEPAADSKDAVREQATGDEEGTATPDNDPNADPTRSKKDLQQKDGEPPATRDPQQGGQDGSKNESGKSSNASGMKKDGSSKKSAGSKDGQAKRDSGDANENGTEQPATDDATDNPRAATKKSSTDQGRPDKKKAENSPDAKAAQDRKPTDKAGDDATQGDAPSGKDGEEGNGKEPDPMSDRPGEASPDSKDQKSPSSQQKPQGGKKKQAPNKPPQPDESEAKPGEDSGGETTNPGGGEAGEDRPGGQPAGKPGGQPGSEQRSDSDDPASGSPQGGRDDGAFGSGQGAGDSSAPPADDPNLDFSKKAADLVLNRLEQDLKRGEVDPELLKELGWTEDDVRRFTERLRQQLNQPPAADTPESLARRRQFEEMLKSLNLGKQSRRRESTNANERAVDTVGPRRTPVPNEYRESYEAFTRDRARRNGE